MNDLYNPVISTLVTTDIDHLYVKKLIGEIQALNVFAAKNVETKTEALILEINTKTLKGIKDWPRSKGFEVIPETITSGLSGRTRLYLQLLNDRYRDVFNSLCVDICNVLGSACEEKQAIQDFHVRLEHWQSFLKNHGFEGLSENQRCGLYGELKILRDLLIPHVDSLVSLSAWRGYKKAHQDFQFLDLALEVKATRAAIADRIKISNVQQLDDEGFENLFLTVVHLHENETVGETLIEIIEGLRSVLPVGGLELFEQGLEEVGYLDSHRKMYSTTRYQHLGSHHYRVVSGFPRVTRDRIINGVKNVQYEITIDACTPFEVNEVEIINLLERFKGGHV